MEVSRSIADFLKVMDFFEKHSVTFVSVTQSFNTQNSMGKLMLNILLSFAQFEREVTSERIRDKIAASKKKGMWMGGGKISAGMVYKILNNQVYLGKVPHKGQYYQGEHKAIISEELWNKVHSVMKKTPERDKLPTRTKLPAILKGIIFDSQGNALTPSFTRKKDKIYRYYVNTKAIKQGYENCDLRIFPAEELENFIIAKIRQLVTTPELINKVTSQAKALSNNITPEYVRTSLADFNNVWEHLFPIEKTRIIQLLICRIVVGLNGVQITFLPNGLLNLCQQINKNEKKKVA